MQSISQFVPDLAYGAAIGAALGLTGSGGSILTVPALVYLVGLDVHAAIGTSLAVVGGIATEGVIEQRDSVQWKAGLLLGACGIAGNIPGSLLSAGSAKRCTAPFGSLTRWAVPERPNGSSARRLYAWAGSRQAAS